MATLYNQTGYIYNQIGAIYNQAVIERTATGTGTGTSNNTIVLGLLRTGYGSGGADTFDTALWNVNPVRLATGSGTGSSSSNGFHISPRTATGLGTGTSATLTLYVALRTATSSGQGASTASRIVKNIRAASGSGAGTSTTLSGKALFRACTGSGTGSAVSVHYKFHMFRPPVELVGPFMLLRGDKIANKLGRRFEPFERGKNVYQLNNLSFTENDPWSPDNYIKVFHGGHVHALTENEYTALVAAGYGANIT